jgi:hypothetical protein
VAAWFTLPVSGIRVALRSPTGLDDLLLLDLPSDEAAALALAQQLTVVEDDVDWAELTPTDLDAFVLRLRQARLGDRIQSHATCGSEGCACRVDMSFGIEAYLYFHQPKAARGRGWQAMPLDSEPGWFCLHGPAASAEPRFRLPSVADLMVARGAADPQRALAAACLQAKLDPTSRRHIDVAMTAMAPPLSGELLGSCPDCGSAITVLLEPRVYCLRELRERARFIYEDVDLLASRYHWPEKRILAMPNHRRQAYVELALSGAA